MFKLFGSLGPALHASASKLGNMASPSPDALIVRTALDLTDGTYGEEAGDWDLAWRPVGCKKRNPRLRTRKSRRRPVAPRSSES
ncbi:hypothetical protein HK405_008779, partial [Cladochytrium tenue]